MHQVFISYPIQDQDIIDNLRERLVSYGIKAWVYSHDKTISKDIWEEINEKIMSCKMILFVVSKHTNRAKGQHKELEFAIEKISSSHPHISIVPVIIGDIRFSDVPESINHINGIHLDIYNIKTVTLENLKNIEARYTTQRMGVELPITMPVARSVKFRPMDRGAFRLR